MNTTTANTPARLTPLTLVSNSMPTPTRRPRPVHSSAFQGPYTPRTEPIYALAPELPPRRFKAGQQPRGTVTGAEAAACLGVSEGRFRAITLERGLAVFAYGPSSKAVYWRKSVEEIRDLRNQERAARAGQRASRRVETVALAA